MGGNTGFSGEPHLHMMVYLNRLIDENVHWQSIPIQFKEPKLPLSGQRYAHYIKSLYLDPLLIPTDRIQTDNMPNWNEIDYIPNGLSSSSEFAINEEINSMLYYAVGELSTLESDVIIVPLSLSNTMNNWLSCRVLRRGGPKLMRHLIMKRGYDLMYTAKLRLQQLTAQHKIKYKKDCDVSENILIVSAFDQLPCKKIMFVLMDNDETIISSKCIEKIFSFLCRNHESNKNQKIRSIAFELPIFEESENVNLQLRAIRVGLEKYAQFVSNHCLNKVWTMKQCIICAQTLHDLHCYTDLIATFFPRNASISRLHCEYIAHCPCNQCYTNEYGLGQLHKKYKIELHANGIEQDLCSGIPKKKLHLINVLKPGQPTPNNAMHRLPQQSFVETDNESNIDPQFEDIELIQSKIKIDKISFASESDFKSESLHQIKNKKRKHSKRPVFRRRKKRKIEMNDVIAMDFDIKSKQNILSTLRQTNFLKKSDKKQLLIHQQFEKYRTIFEERDMAKSLTPKIPSLLYLIQCVAPKQEYYSHTIANINLEHMGFAQIAIQQMKHQRLVNKEEKIKNVKKERATSVNCDNFEKIQNIIGVIVKNKMAFCSTKIRSHQHAIHHVTNCSKCMSTLEQFKGTVFK